MANINKNYRVHVYENGDPETVDFTVPLAAPPNLPTSPIIRPSTISAEGASGSLSVVDENDKITNNLANQGRMHVLGRRIVLQRQIDSGAWTDLYGGRLTNLALNSDIGSWKFSVADEMHALRNNDLFATVGDDPTTSLYPAGIKYPWSTFHNETVGKGHVSYIDTAARILYIDSWVPVTPSFVSFMQEDALPDYARDGTINHQKWKHAELVIEDQNGNVKDTLNDFRFLNDDPVPGRKVIGLWFLDGSSLNNINLDDRAYIHAPGAEPSENNPLHTGTLDLQIPFVPYPHFPNNNEWRAVSNPINFLEAAFDNLDIRYDQTNLDSFKSRFAGIGMAYRITSPQNAGSWIDNNILIPFGIILTTNNSGTVELKDFRLPDVSNIDLETMFTFSHSNTRAPYPTFEHGENEAITDIDFTARRYSFIQWDHNDDFDADGIIVSEIPIHRSYEPEGNIIRKTVEVDIEGAPTDFEQHHGFYRSMSLDSIVDRVEFETFTKFGDGPIIGTIYGQHDADQAGIRPGDIVKFDLDQYPNPSNNIRGGTRLVQILSSKYSPEGPIFNFIDLGPALNPMPSPDLTLSTHTDNPRNAIDWQVTNIIPSAGIIIEISYDNTDNWFPIVTLPWQYILQSSGSLTNVSGTITNQPSGTQVFARVRQVKFDRLPSDWSTPVSHTTASLPAPTNLNATVFNASVSITWDNSIDDYPLMPVLDGDDFKRRPLPSNSKSFVYDQLSSNTQVEVGVKYVDPYGGESPAVTTTVTTGSAKQLIAPDRITMLQGRSETADSYPPEEETIGYGYEIKIIPAEKHAHILVQVSTDALFDSSDIVLENVMTPGQSRIFLFLPNDDTERFIRAKHVREGFEDSDWSPIVSGYPTGLLDDSPDIDDFASGFAFLSLNGAGEVVLTVGHGDDPDTDRAYYDFEIDPDPVAFPEVDENSEFIERADMTYTEVLLDDLDDPIVLEDDQTIYLTVRFWNEEAGFGQRTLDTIRVPISIHGNPLLDLDLKELFLFPRYVAAQSVRWAVDTNDYPTLNDVENAGNLSTDDVVKIHDFTTNNERVYVSAVLYLDTGGTSSPSSLFQMVKTFNSERIRPRVHWRRAIPDGEFPQDQEAIEVIVRDDQEDVALFYRTYTDGDSVPSYTREPSSGYTADPLVHKITVNQPEEGDPDVIIEMYAEDEAGNDSLPTTIVRVDGDNRPSGVFLPDLNKETGIPKVIPQSTDSDTGSWRFRVVPVDRGSETFHAPLFIDISSNTITDNSHGHNNDDELTFATDEEAPGDLTAGSYWVVNATVDTYQLSDSQGGAALDIKQDEFSDDDLNKPFLLPGYKTVKGDQLNILGYFFRTKNPAHNTQRTSKRSPEVTAEIHQDSESSVYANLNGIFTTISEFNLQTWVDIKLKVDVGEDTDNVSGTINYSLGGVGQTPHDFNENITLTEGQSLVTIKIENFTTFSGTIHSVELKGSGTIDGESVESQTKTFEIEETFTDLNNKSVGVKSGKDKSLKSGLSLSLHPAFKSEEVDGDTSLALASPFDEGSVSGTWNPDYEEGAVQIASLSGNTTIALPSNMSLGDTISILITTNSNTLSFSSAWNFPGGSPSGLTGTVAVSGILFTSGFIAAGILNDLS